MSRGWSSLPGKTTCICYGSYGGYIYLSKSPDLPTIVGRLANHRWQVRKPPLAGSPTTVGRHANQRWLARHRRHMTYFRYMTNPSHYAGTLQVRSPWRASPSLLHCFSATTSALLSFILQRFYPYAHIYHYFACRPKINLRTNSFILLLSPTLESYFSDIIISIFFNEGNVTIMAAFLIYDQSAFIACSI